DPRHGPAPAAVHQAKAVAPQADDVPRLDPDGTRDAPAVDGGAVGGGEVLEEEGASGAAHTGVPLGHGGVPEDHLATGVLAEGHDRGAEGQAGERLLVGGQPLGQEPGGGQVEPAEVDDVLLAQRGPGDLAPGGAEGGAVDGVQVLEEGPAAGDDDAGVVGRD